MEKEFRLKIGKLLNRVVRLTKYDWGIYAVVEDRTEGYKNAKFSSRKFQICERYPTIEDCEQRAMKYYKIKID